MSFILSRKETFRLHYPGEKQLQEKSIMRMKLLLSKATSLMQTMKHYEVKNKACNQTMYFFKELIVEKK